MKKEEETSVLEEEPIVSNDEIKLKSLTTIDQFKHPLTALVTLVPAGIVSEVYRYLADDKNQTFTDSSFLDLSQYIGINLPLMPVVFLLVGCLIMTAIKRDWNFPQAKVVVYIPVWILAWTAIRILIGFSSHTTLADSVSVEDLPETIYASKEELKALGIIGFSFSSALQEELIFRLGFIGVLSALFSYIFGKAEIIKYIFLVISAVIFSLAHTNVINHTNAAAEFELLTATQHCLAGLLYGFIFIRQGLVVAVGTHFFYNACLIAGLFNYF